ncbi:MAG TPA: Trp biosynthesis-associated membrane protein, partial [Kineosporiaceae bacterium]|nr:Trp biosynthesis-associated membrane protein [Kineosporiaceae bacterium]
MTPQADAAAAEPERPAPDPPTSQPPTSQPPRTRSRLSATLAVLVGAGIVLVAESRNWATVRVSGVPGRAVVTADGRLAAPGTGALALVAAAGALAMAVAGRWARLLVAGLLVLAGLAVAGLAIAVLHSPGDAVEPAVATATGTVGRPLDGVATATGWPVLCVV